QKRSAEFDNQLEKLASKKSVFLQSSAWAEINSVLNIVDPVYIGDSKSVWCLGFLRSPKNAREKSLKHCFAELMVSSRRLEIVAGPIGIEKASAKQYS